ncbi:MAG TPA: HD domain-containing protein [Nitrospirae bacterium]|nr:cyclic di-GMP phosphodiesterase response regulator RpfG [bacterium BMS3Abin10]GBE38240.1 cyclic di-GMP phosphodiesterase response regulator RpfG [bacterium BMS3Bbin08]HDH51804.1 HD domain-containing protein [Nitrospirota bacterium]HDK81748.1 HD domain-containing protein [Nitrospirota bacterium]
MKSIKHRHIDRESLEDHIKGWRPLINSLPYPLSVHDTEFDIVMANGPFFDFFKKAGDIADMKCYQLFHCSDTAPPESCPMQRTLKTGKPEIYEILEPSLERYLSVMTSPVRDKNGRIIGVIRSFSDITELKKFKNTHEEIQNSRDAFFNMLEDLTESYMGLEELFIKLTTAMVNALDAKSPWTKGHSENVALYAGQIALEMGYNEGQTKNLKLAGLLHDIGKIGTYDYLLDKPSKLRPEEYEIVKKHPSQGEKILEGIKQLKDVIPLIRHHHERFDGKGYPDGLKGEDIPLCARILHVADSFDSMTEDRPYRSNPGLDYAIAELKKHSGTQFDPGVVKAFLRSLKKQKKI